MREKLLTNHTMFVSSEIFRDLYTYEYGYWAEGMPLARYERALERYGVEGYLDVTEPPAVDRMYERALQLSAGLMHVGIFNSVTNDTTVMDDVANILGKGDVCVVISQKGRDYDAYALLMDAIRENGGEVFFVTVNARSQFISHASSAIVLPSIMNGGRSDLADAQLTIYMYLEILLDEVAYLQSKAEGANGEASAPDGGGNPRPEQEER